MKHLYLLLATCLWVLSPTLTHLQAQCTHQVTHTSGSAIVAGVNVTVTSTGNTCAWTTYCPAVTQPYFIGYNPGLGSGPGSFTFTFSPAIGGLRFNFSGASNTAPSVEEVRLHINGSHYAMTAPGAANACDPMAILTVAGDLRGCVGCGVSGWANTSITGFPITTLTVEDFVVGGSPNGSLFSMWICNTILPAEWVEVEAEVTPTQAVDVRWVTATEINNDFFTVERSRDGLSWTELAVVSAVGNSETQQAYHFLDQRPVEGDNHYRIRQTSLDGGSSHSEVRQVTVVPEGLRLGPNPAQAVVHLTLQDSHPVQVKVFNVWGAEVHVPQSPTPSGMDLDTSHLSPGIYLIQVKQPHRTVSRKLIVE